MLIDSASEFKRCFKRLARKSRSLPEEMTALFARPEADPAQGQSLGEDLYKIRLASASRAAAKVAASALSPTTLSRRPLAK